MKLIVLALLTLSAFGQAPLGSGITQPSSSSGGPPTGAAGGALTGTYPNPGISSGSVAIIQSANQTSTGDSITAGVGATSTSLGYANLISVDAKATLNNIAVSGQLACDLADTQSVKTVLSTADNNPLYTLMVGTNDANTKGVGAYEAVYKGCHLAAISWIAVANKLAANSTNCTDTGTWTAMTSYALNGEISQTSGSTKSCTLTTYGGPLYAWYQEIDGNGGTFTYAVDGGSATSLTTATTPAIATQNGGTAGWNLIRVTGLTAGSHTIVFIVTSATSSSNTVTIAAVGTTAPQLTRMRPNVFVGGVPKQQADNLSSTTAAYNSDALADVNLLASDGLPVFFVPIRNYLCTTLVSSVCQGVSGVPDMQTGSGSVHPINAGHNELKQAWENQMQFASSGSTAPIMVGTASGAASTANYSNVNSFNLGNTSSLNQGINVYANNGNTYGMDLGYFAGNYVTRLYAATNAVGTGVAICSSGTGTFPTSQSSFNCPFFFPSYNSNPASVYQYANINANNVASTTNFVAGLSLYQSTNQFWGLDFAYDSSNGKYATRLSATTANGEINGCFTSAPTAIGNFNCVSKLSATLQQYSVPVQVAQIQSGTASNTDLVGELSFSAATTASYTFAGTYTSHPECWVQSQGSTASSGTPYPTYTGATSMTINFPSAFTGNVSYGCIGRN